MSSSKVTECAGRNAVRKPDGDFVQDRDPSEVIVGLALPLESDEVLTLGVSLSTEPFTNASSWVTFLLKNT